MHDIFLYSLENVCLIYSFSNAIIQGEFDTVKIAYS